MATTGTGAQGSPPTGSGQLPVSALAFARRVHLGQNRKQTHDQYVEHPIAVAEVAAAESRESRDDGVLLAAAYLHDVVEKTTVTHEEISQRFGPEVGEIVAALSDDPAIDSYAERKRELRGRALGSGHCAALIYAADRIANVRDWLSVAPDRRAEVAESLGTSLDERLELWNEDLDAISSTPMELSFLAELELGLRELRASA